VNKLLTVYEVAEHGHLSTHAYKMKCK